MSGKLYYNGDILTMEKDPYAEAVWVKDGKIRAVGSRACLLKNSCGAEPVDLKGKTMLPAFIDPHSHITSFASTIRLVHLDGVKSFDDILARIKAYQKERNVKPGEWITGFGYDHNFLKEHAHPTKELLDKAGPQNPIVMTHASGHMGVMNSLALREAGVTAETADPDGGLIGREPGSREPNGYLEEAAFTSLTSKIPGPSFETLCSQFRDAQDIYLKNGITTAQDGFTKEGEWKLLKNVSDHGGLKMDVVCYPDLEGSRRIVKENLEYRGIYRNKLKIGGYKVFLDGSPQGRTAWMSKPYCNTQDGYCGYSAHQEEEVKAYMETALKEGVQILAHCNGDAAAEQMIDAYEAARLNYPFAPDIRPVMIHAQLVRRDQLSRMAGLKMIASFFVAHTYYWGDVHLENFGAERAVAISPAKSALDKGVVYTFHQDTPVILPNMLETVWCAVNRMSKTGIVLGESERISPLDALKGVTINAAYQYFEEKSKGSIREGKHADLVILDRNPLKVDPGEIKNIQVLETMKDGISVFKA